MRNMCSPCAPAADLVVYAVWLGFVHLLAFSSIPSRRDDTNNNFLQLHAVLCSADDRVIAVVVV